MIYYMSVRGKGGFYVGKCEELRSRWELTCTHTFILTHTLTHPHTYTLAYTHTYLHMPHINTPALIYIRTHTHKHAHRDTLTYIYTHSHTYIPIHTDTPTLTNPHSHTYTHSYTHTHTHTHTMSLKSKSPKTQRVGGLFYISQIVCWYLVRRKTACLSLTPRGDGAPQC